MSNGLAHTSSVHIGCWPSLGFGGGGGNAVVAVAVAVAGVSFEEAAAAAAAAIVVENDEENEGFSSEANPLNGKTEGDDLQKKGWRSDDQKWCE